MMLSTPVWSHLFVEIAPLSWVRKEKKNPSQGLSRCFSLQALEALNGGSWAGQVRGTVC